MEIKNQKQYPQGYGNTNESNQYTAQSGLCQPNIGYSTNKETNFGGNSGVMHLPSYQQFIEEKMSAVANKSGEIKRKSSGINAQETN